MGCRLNGKDLWIPKVKDVGGLRLMYLSKWDRGLTRFLTGKSLDLRNNAKNLNSTAAGAYLDDLVRKKKEASQAAVLKAHESAHESDAGHEVKAKGKKRKVTDDMSCFSPLVQISLPAVHDPWMPERLVQVEFGGQSDLWMEVNETSLRQVVQGICACNSKCGRARTSKSEKIKPELVLPLPLRLRRKSRRFLRVLMPSLNAALVMSRMSHVNIIRLPWWSLPRVWIHSHTTAMNRTFESTWAEADYRVY